MAEDYIKMIDDCEKRLSHLKPGEKLFIDAVTDKLATGERLADKYADRLKTIWRRVKVQPVSGGAAQSKPEEKEVIAVNNTEFKIESDVPIPKRKVQSRYPFDAMKVDDSFFIPKKLKNLTSVTNNANKTRAPKKFTARYVEGGVRVWRTK